ncbi:lysozyme [Sphingosinicella sp. BN140058]|nr:lysozyme [Sphingosinicella sp. BN140058]
MIGLAAGIGLLLALGLFLYASSWHPSNRAFPIQGVDVSHHQGRIDWKRIKRQGVDFAYLKATEGADHRDTMFTANLKASAAAGIPRGAYHFFTLCRSGADQAANFIAAVPRNRRLLPPAVDLEFGGNCGARPDRVALLRELDIFLKRVEAHAGKQAILYITREFDAAYRVSEAIDRPLWLRRLARRPDYGARPWALWQASNVRRLRGIGGRVDWNVVAPGCDFLARREACPPPRDGQRSPT